MLRGVLCGEVFTNKKAVLTVDSPFLTGIEIYRAIQARPDRTMRRMAMVIGTIGKAGLKFIAVILLQ
jgi:hypothetical protein